MSWPASFYTGPLGVNNVVPDSDPGVMLGMWAGISGNPAGTAGQRTFHLDRMRDAGRGWTFIQAQIDGMTFGGVSSEDWINSPKIDSGGTPRAGSIPLVTWSPSGTIAQILAGSADAEIDTVATRYAGKTYRILIRLFHEFNDPHSTPWTPTNYKIGLGGTPTPSATVSAADFNAAWQRVVNRFLTKTTAPGKGLNGQGINNVGFVWSPIELAGGNATLTWTYWPGNTYVDIASSDRYNADVVGFSAPMHGGWAEFGELFDYTNNYGGGTFTGAPGQSYSNRWGTIKPFVIGETGSKYDTANVPSGHVVDVNRKANWYRNIGNIAIPLMTNLHGLVFYDIDNAFNGSEPNDWRVDHNQPSGISTSGSFDAVTYQGWKDLVALPVINADAVPVGSSGDTTAPTAPTNLLAAAISSTQINLTWTAATDAVGVTQYRIERCSGVGCANFVQIGTDTASPFTDTGLTASTSYSYRVRASDAAGNLGPYSNTSTVATQTSGLPYTPTTWVNDTTPALNATNLNKVTNQLISQAIDKGISHSLPTWTNGGPPAVSDPAPLNEMERVAQAVASSVLLTYTPTAWNTGWIPARNAARLNHLEAQVQANRAAINGDTPPAVGATLGASYLRFGNGELPTSHITDYDNVVVSYGGAPAAGSSAAKRALVYQSAITCQSTPNTGVSSTECLSNGWQLIDTTGAGMTSSQYGGPLGDMGLVAYQNRWCQNVEARLASWGLEGVFIDDVVPYLGGISGGKTSVKYPTAAAVQAAFGSFTTAVYNYFNTRGKYIIINAAGYIPGDGGSDNGTVQLNFWQQLKSHAFCAETWQVRPDTGRRHQGAGYQNEWDNWQRLPAYCQTAGASFIGINATTPSGDADYQMCSMLLETDRGSIFYCPGSYDSYDRNTIWHSFDDRLKTLGTPQGAKVHNGNRWQRQYTGGLVWADPVAATSGII